MTNQIIKNTWTIYQDRFNCDNIKKLEQNAAGYRQKLNEWRESATDDQLKKQAEEWKRIKTWFAENSGVVRKAKNEFKEEQRSKGSLINKAANGYFKDHNHYYGRGFMWFKEIPNKYLDKDEQEIVHNLTKSKYFWENKEAFKIKHIAWSLLKGRTFQQILPNSQKYVNFKKVDEELTDLFKTICSQIGET